ALSTAPSTLSLHAALPICGPHSGVVGAQPGLRGDLACLGELVAGVDSGAVERAHHEPAGTLLGAGAPRGVVAGGFPHLVRDALAAAPPGIDAVTDAADRGVEAQQGVQPQPLEPWRVAVRVGVLQLVDGGVVDVLSPGVGGEHLDPLVEGLLEPGRGLACPAREVSAVQAFDDGSDELDQQVPPDGEVGPAVE